MYFNVSHYLVSWMTQIISDYLKTSLKYYVFSENSPVQNCGSSLWSSQWSMPSQNLSRGIQRPFPLHENSDILHDRTSVMKFNNIMPQATVVVSHRMICEIMKNEFQSLHLLFTAQFSKENLFCISSTQLYSHRRSMPRMNMAGVYQLNGACTHNYKLIINYYDYSISITRFHAFEWILLRHQGFCGFQLDFAKPFFIFFSLAFDSYYDSSNFLHYPVPVGWDKEKKCLPSHGHPFGHLKQIY